LIIAVVEMREDDTLKLTNELLDGGTAPMEILDACRGTTDVIGERLEKGDAFLPELMLAGEMWCSRWT
jgi:methanogenic corrinoid protein MtbC1